MNDLFDRIYSVLVTGGASESQRGNFIAHAEQWLRERLAREHFFPIEWRFGGDLGHGGKFFCHTREMRVYYYPEDRTPERDAFVASANAALAPLLAEYLECLAAPRP